MAEPRATPSTRQHGFTLTEMLVALGILLVGTTSLLAVLGGGVSLRRSTEARREASYLAEQAVLRVRQALQRQPGGSALDVGLAPLEGQQVEGFPGMTWSAASAEDPDRPDVLLVTIVVQWLEDGETIEQEFLRILPRSEPLGARIARWQQDNGIEPR